MDNEPSQLTPDEAKASLGVANHLMSHLMPQAPQEPQPAPESPTNQETTTDTQAQMQGLETRIMDEIGALKEEIKKAQPKDAGSEIEALKKEIEAVLNSND